MTTVTLARVVHRTNVAVALMVCAGGVTPTVLLAAAEPEFKVVTIAEGLEDPWAIAALPNGDVLVTEKAGRLRLIRGGHLQAAPIEGVPKVRAGGQGGLMDIVLAPDFAASRWVYMTIAKSNADDSLGTTALVRARFDGTRLTDLQEIIETKAWGEARAHYGTRLAFDASGHVFLSIADRTARSIRPDAIFPSTLRNSSIITWARSCA